MMRRLVLVPLLFVMSLFSGCLGHEPSDAVFEDYLTKVVNDYWLYAHHFEIVELKRTNGWKDGENYVIQGEVKLRSRSSYMDLLGEQFESIEKEVKANSSSAMALGLQSMLNGMSGAKEDFSRYWSEQVKAGQVSASLSLKQRQMNATGFENIIVHADRVLLENFGAIIGRPLQKDDELVRTYTLVFKKTEKGWMGFSAS